jgi:hypothetical protein
MTESIIYKENITTCVLDFKTVQCVVVWKNVPQYDRINIAETALSKSEKSSRIFH